MRPRIFHAYYGEREAKFDLETGAVIDGKLPAAQRKLVQKWIEMYKTELEAAWTAVRNDITPERIPGPDADNDN